MDGKNQVVIRKGKAGDEDRVNVLGRLIDPGVGHYDSWDMHLFYVATLGDKIIGMACLGWSESDPEPRYEMIGCMDYELSMFGVHPAYRRSGIGTRIMRRIYEDLRFYLGVARVEWIVATGSYDFYVRATEGMGVSFVKLCPKLVKEPELPCECDQCRDGGPGLDRYHSCFGFDGCSHLAILMKLETFLRRDKNIDGAVVDHACL